jgi:glycosyltransferase involved in cell wall biosynthesis
MGPLFLDNIIFSLQKAGGISVYWFELLKRLSRSVESAVSFEYAGAVNNLFRKRLSNSMAIHREWGRIPAPIGRYLPFMVRFKEPSIFHSSYYRVAIQENVANIVTVYDFTYERFRKGLPKLVHFWQKRFALQRANGIICISESTKKDLLRYHPEMRQKNIRVIYLGGGEEFCVLDDTPLVDEKVREIISTKYMLFIGARAGYKNFEIAVNVVSKIPDCRLLIVGGGRLSSLETSALETKLQGRYHFFVDVDACLLNVFYNYAFCLLYVSSYEGFGIPVIEAMRAGCPVVALDVSSMPEACGDAGLLVNNVEPDNFLEKIKLLEERSFRDGVIQRGRKHAARFSWDLCHRQTKEFYHEVFEEKFMTPFEKQDSSMR